MEVLLILMEQLVNPISKIKQNNQPREQNYTSQYGISNSYERL